MTTVKQTPDRQSFEVTVRTRNIDKAAENGGLVDPESVAGKWCPTGSLHFQSQEKPSEKRYDPQEQ